MMRLALPFTVYVVLAGSAAWAQQVIVTSIAPDARCRNAQNVKIGIRPFPPFQATLDASRGVAITMLRGTACYLDISEVGTGNRAPCSSAAEGRPNNSGIAGSRDAPTTGGCTQ